MPVCPTELITRRFQVHRVHLATAFANIKECVGTKEFCMKRSSCCQCVQICALTANLKFPPSRYKNASCTYKIIKIHYKFKNSKHKLNPCITIASVIKFNKRNIIVYRTYYGNVISKKNMFASHKSSLLGQHTVNQ